MTENMFENAEFEAALDNMLKNNTMNGVAKKGGIYALMHDKNGNIILNMQFHPKQMVEMYGQKWENTTPDKMQVMPATRDAVKGYVKQCHDANAAQKKLTPEQIIAAQQRLAMMMLAAQQQKNNVR